MPTHPADDGLRALVAELVDVYRRLSPFGIASVSDYAEHLFERATLGRREKRGTRGFDVLAPMYGRIQVKCRRLPDDGRIEQRLLCRNVTAGSFDYLGAVIFEPNLTIKCALMISHAAVWPLIESHPDRQKKIAFQQVARLNGVIDFTDRLRRS